MLVKMGVDISRLDRKCRRTLNTVEDVFQKLVREEPVITSTYEGTHSPSSLHYANLAYDLRLPAGGGGTILAALVQKFGPKFDVILEADHIHVEYEG